MTSKDEELVPSIKVDWKPSRSACDVCGKFTGDTELMTIILTNKKSELGYKLPALILCAKDQDELMSGITRGENDHTN